MKPFPKIETPRLLLDRLQFVDIPSIVIAGGNPKVSKYTLNIPHPYEEEDAISWINAANVSWKTQQGLVLAIREKASRDFLGGIGMSLNNRAKIGTMGYWLKEEAWNKGFITEAADAFFRFAFTYLDLNKICSSYFRENAASGRVMEKLGMEKEGVMKQQVWRDGRFFDLVHYGLLKENYLK